MKNQHKYRNKQGRYSSLEVKILRRLGYALVLLVVLWHVKDANKPVESKLEHLQRTIVELELKQADLKDQNIIASNTINNSTQWKTKYRAVATAYSCGGITTDAQLMMNCPSKLTHPNGKTAIGTIPVVGKTVACNPSMLGKHIVIKGFGSRTCEDTGSAIKGNRIDIYMSDIQLAFAYGIHTIEYTIE
jgi:3D (Asp-Asp-Asp) domain-containing protein